MLESLWPLLAMAVAAFAAGTLLPLSSEAALAGAILSGVAGPAALVAAATFGNVLGAWFNWWIGLHVRRFEARRWFPFKPADVERASAHFQRFGSWCLLFSWLPVVGDPLTLAAGVLRVPIVPFLALVTVGKASRYVVLAALM